MEVEVEGAGLELDGELPLDDGDGLPLPADSLEPERRSTGGPSSASPVITVLLACFLGWLAASLAASRASLASMGSSGFH